MSETTPAKGVLVHQQPSLVYGAQRTGSWRNLLGWGGKKHPLAEASSRGIADTQLAPPKSRRVPDDAPRAGLDTGDAVVLVTRLGVPYVLSLEEDATESGKTVYKLQQGAEGTPLEAAAVLEVVHKDEWLGLCCGAAEGRFLQARRKGGDRLAFFSPHLGVWEQWELVAGDLSAAWSREEVVLRNRQLPQVELRVDLVRVGTFTSEAASPAPARGKQPQGAELVGLPEGISEEQQLQRVSGLMISEWTHFVEREKKIRVALAARVAKVQAQFALLKKGTHEQVEVVRRQLHRDLEGASRVLKHQEEQLAAAKQALERRLQVAVNALDCRVERERCRAVLQAWRQHTAVKSKWAHSYLRIRQRRQAASLRGSFRAWAAYKEGREAKRAQVALAERHSALVLKQAAFYSWLGRAPGGIAPAKVVEQALARRRLKQLHSCFLAWREDAIPSGTSLHLGAMLAKRHQRSILAAATQAWASTAQRTAAVRAGLERFVALRSQILLRRVWHALQSNLETSRRQAEEAEALSARARQGKQAALFLTWAEAVASRKRTRALVLKALGAQVQRRLSTSLRAWLQHTREAQMLRTTFARFVDRLARARAAVVFAAWQQTAQRATAQHRLIARHRAKALACRMRLVLAGWKRHVSGRRERIQQAEQRFASLHRALLASCFSAWRGATEGQQAREEFAVQWAQARDRRQRLERVKLAWNAWQEATAAAASVQSWLSLITPQAAADSQAARQRLQLTSSLLWGWREAAGRQRAERAKLRAFVGRTARTRLQGVLSVWQSAVSGSEATVATALRQRTTRQQRGIFQAWRSAAVEGAGKVEAARAHADNRVKHASLLLLAEYARLAKAKRQELAWARKRLARAALHRVACAWQVTAVHDLPAARAKLQSVVQAATSVPASSIFAAWAQQAQRACRRREEARGMAQEGLRGSLRRALQAWASITLDHKEAAQKLERLSAARILAASGCQGSAFMQIPGSCSAGARQLALQYAAWSAWQEHCQVRRRHRLLLSRCLDKLTHASLSTALAAWRDAHAAAKERAELAAQRAQQRQVAAKQAAFDRWRRAWQETVEGRSRLRACLTRKRIALRHYQLHYWETFNKDVQATLAKLYAHTEGSMSSPIPSYPSPISSPLQPLPLRLLGPSPAYSPLRPANLPPPQRELPESALQLATAPPQPSRESPGTPEGKKILSGAIFAPPVEQRMESGGSGRESGEAAVAPQRKENVDPQSSPTLPCVNAPGMLLSEPGQQRSSKAPHRPFPFEGGFVSLGGLARLSASPGRVRVEVLQPSVTSEASKGEAAQATPSLFQQGQRQPGWVYQTLSPNTSPVQSRHRTPLGTPKGLSTLRAAETGGSTTAPGGEESQEAPLGKLLEQADPSPEGLRRRAVWSTGQNPLFGQGEEAPTSPFSARPQLCGSTATSVASPGMKHLYDQAMQEIGSSGEESAGVASASATKQQRPLLPLSTLSAAPGGSGSAESSHLSSPDDLTLRGSSDSTAVKQLFPDSGPTEVERGEASPRGLPALELEAWAIKGGSKVGVRAAGLEQVPSTPQVKADFGSLTGLLPSTSKSYENPAFGGDCGGEQMAGRKIWC